MEEGALASSMETPRQPATLTEDEAAEWQPAVAEAESSPSAGPTTAPGRWYVNDADLNTDIVIDSMVVVLNATLYNEEEVVIATPILPWWKQSDVYVLLGTMLVLLAAFGTAIGMSSRNVASTGDVGDLLPEEGVTINITAPRRGSHGTCPSDDSAQGCGATLEIWMDIVGWSILNLVVVTENFALSPNKTERLIDTLTGPVNLADHYGCRISGWLVPPITSDEYVLMVVSGSDDESELWLSTDDDPVNKVIQARFINSLGFNQTEQYSNRISFIAGRSYYFEALMKEGDRDDRFAVAWQYPGLGQLEFIPAIYSRTKKPVSCAVDLDCDDEIWCNGDETCNEVGLCEFGAERTCSDGLYCTDDICNESAESCENPTTDCLASGDHCATDQCIESLGGCQFICGATLDTWSELFIGFYLEDFRVTNKLVAAPTRTERLGSLLEAPTNTADYYASRIKGWLVPPVTGDYVFWIAADETAALWLSTNDQPENGILVCSLTLKTEPRQWMENPEQESEPIPLVAGQAYYFEALMKEISDTDNLAIAWQYPGQALEVVPARYSRMTRPTTWPANCAVNSDCDDGIWCNGDETCSDVGVCQLGYRTCSDGLLCTDDICNELTDSCENPVANCSKSSDPCATDQCIESLRGCQFSCGATLETWTDIDGFTILDLMSGTSNFATPPNRTERLGNLLEAQFFVGDQYGIRMKGWLAPPVSGSYRFWISSDDSGEFWLSTNDDPANMVLVCYQPYSSPRTDWFYYRGQQSEPIALVGGQAYYFEAMMKEQVGLDHLAIAWQYPGQSLEVIPARYSMITRPTPAANTTTSPIDIVDEQPVGASAFGVLPDTAVVQTVSIYDAGKAGPNFSTLMAFVDAAGLADVVSGPGPITVLAIDDASWYSLAATFPAGVTLETYILPENIGLLQDILYYHIIDGSHPIASFVSGNLTTLNGDTVSVEVSDAGISFNDAYIIEPDYMFDNGIVHVIESVLLPPGDPFPAK